MLKSENRPLRTDPDDAPKAKKMRTGMKSEQINDNDKQESDPDFVMDTEATVVVRKSGRRTRQSAPVNVLDTEATVVVSKSGRQKRQPAPYNVLDTEATVVVSKSGRQKTQSAPDNVQDSEATVMVRKSGRQTRPSVKLADEPETPISRRKGKKKSAENRFDGPIPISDAKKLTAELIHAPFSHKLTIASNVVVQKIVSRKDLSIYGLGHHIDGGAAQLYRESCEIANASVYPMLVKGDGNCLPRCGSLLAYGSEEYHHDIRIRIALELIMNKTLYLDSAYLCRGVVDTCGMPSPELFLKLSCGLVDLSESVSYYYNQDINDILKKDSYMGIYQLFALASVLRRPIQSIYPDKGVLGLHKFFNRLILPNEIDCQDPVYIMWCSTRDESLTSEYWIANHFVTLLPLYQHEEPNK